MKFEITGTISKVLPPVTGVGQRGPWGRQTIILNYKDGNYDKFVALENSNKYEEFGRLQVGQSITAKFDVSCREWQGKYFTSLNCFAWTVLGGATAPQQPTQQQPTQQPTNGENLPF